MLSGATGNLDKATWTVQDRQAEPMQLRDCGDQAQSKPYACRMAAPVRTVEALEYGLPFGSADPGTRVLLLTVQLVNSVRQAASTACAVVPEQSRLPWSVLDLSNVGRFCRMDLYLPPTTNSQSLPTCPLTV